MLFGLLFGLGVGKALYNLCFPLTAVGVKCELCSWSWRDPGVHDAFDRVDRDEAGRMFRLHMRDAHPSVAGEL